MAEKPRLERSFIEHARYARIAVQIPDERHPDQPQRHYNTGVPPPEANTRGHDAETTLQASS
jgi:hypothetical protein